MKHQTCAWCHCTRPETMMFMHKGYWFCDIEHLRALLRHYQLNPKEA